MKKSFIVLMSLVTLNFAPAMAQESDSSQEARRAAFDECLASLGIEKPAQGQRPQAMDDSVRESIDACMTEKGFDHPPRRPNGPPPEGGGGGLRRSGSGVQ